jgi:hypothetical protein
MANPTNVQAILLKMNAHLAVVLDKCTKDFTRGIDTLLNNTRTANMAAFKELGFKDNAEAIEGIFTAFRDIMRARTSEERSAQRDRLLALIEALIRQGKDRFVVLTLGELAASILTLIHYCTYYANNPETFSEEVMDQVDQAIVDVSTTLQGAISASAESEIPHELLTIDINAFADLRNDLFAQVYPAEATTRRFTA